MFWSVFLCFSCAVYLLLLGSDTLSSFASNFAVGHVEQDVQKGPREYTDKVCARMSSDCDRIDRSKKLTASRTKSAIPMIAFPATPSFCTTVLQSSPTRLLKTKTDTIDNNKTLSTRFFKDIFIEDFRKAYIAWKYHWKRVC